MSSSSSQLRHVVFDIDGTLVNTEPLVRRAYAEVGVEMPPDAWGQPWTAWLPDLVEAPTVIHRRKTAIYLDMLRMTPPQILPPARLAQDLVRSGIADVGFLTGASLEAATAILDGLRLPRDLLLGWGCTTQMKMVLLGRLPGTVEYYDDDPEVVADFGFFVKAYNWKDLTWTP